MSLALGAGATFVARAVDVFTPHLKKTLHAAHGHTGTSFLHIFQNCNIFNDGAFEQIREKAVREENLLLLEHGQPLIFGKNSDRGIRLVEGHKPEVVQLGNGVKEEDLLVHDEAGPISYVAMLAEMQPPDFPMPLGVIRRIEEPCLDSGIREQIAEITRAKGPGNLRDAIYAGNTWEVG